jgi:catabolite regulation protein CreA
MTHEDVGKYVKRRHGAKLNEMIAVRIKEKISENAISCAEVHSIAVKLNADPAEVGTTIDLLEVRINKCQLGAFR